MIIPSKRQKFQSERGVSIMELLIVIVVIGIVTTFAVTQFGSSRKNFVRQNLAREFKVSLERARFDSVKRRASNNADRSRIVILSPTSYSVTLDYNQNGHIDNPGETRTVDFSNRSDVRIVGSNLVFPVTVSFDFRGHVTAVNEDTPPMIIEPLFFFCEGECTRVTANASNSNSVYVSPTGTVAMLSGGEELPTYVAPTTTNVNSNVSVNPLLAVWTPVASTPTPEPTPTPLQTPTPIPTPTPSITPTPTPSGLPTPIPTPTPVIVYCTAGQRPLQTGCVCRSPMWIRSNGKCQ